MNSPIFINLSPREETCVVCECDVIDGNKGIAMFEGEPVPHDHTGEWGGFTCCETCYAEFDRVEGNESERKVWFASKRREVRLRASRVPCYVGDL